ncbi:MAG: hypothetical protein ACRDEA_18600, partial [Microcystaceae cyanobacterium]
MRSQRKGKEDEFHTFRQEAEVRESEVRSQKSGVRRQKGEFFPITVEPTPLLGGFQGSAVLG